MVLFFFFFFFFTSIYFLSLIHGSSSLGLEVGATSIVTGQKVGYTLDRSLADSRDNTGKGTTAHLESPVHLTSLTACL